jgi:UDP-N-acetylmuramoyl-tripeptide--D-alanyl-D-alanine ligase
MQQTIAKILRWQAKKYIVKNNPKIVVVTGSVGKTSTTQAIATVLENSFRVRKTLHNYNSDIGVPCSIFCKEIPGTLKNPFAWIWIFITNQIQIFRKAPFDILVLELGTDNPGDIQNFSWLKPDIAVVTAVAPEHMEFFKTIDNVAKEELSVASYSDKTIINKNMIDAKYLNYVDSDQIFNYSRNDIQQIGLKSDDLEVVSDHSVDAVSAALGVGRALEMSISDLVVGAKKIKPLKGRMNVLQGINKSKLIDDTYNSSPVAVTAALDYLYGLKTPQRIVLIGNMNELGESSKLEHELIGKYCNPKKLDLIVTLGQDANKYTAKMAKEEGCFVIESDTPYEAAEIIKNHIEPGAAVLLKGSQNGVFAEETVKLLLKNPEDKESLVRQSPFWLKKKANNFNKERL